MRKDLQSDDECDGVLVDTTEALKLRSKRTERLQRKQGLKAKKPSRRRTNLLDLPIELVLQILVLLRPSDALALSQVNRGYHDLIRTEESRIASAISNWRYGCLQRCFQLPVLLEHVHPAIHEALKHEERQELLAIHKKPYQHTQPPDPTRICTCLTCVLRWLALCIIVDFAHWQHHLDQGEPIPTIPRGQQPEWNEVRLAINATKVWRALYRPLWHARLLQAHLESTVRSIRRHAANRGNQRRRFAMSPAEAASGTDAFLERRGPPTLDFPFHRDAYYMLEAYLPNRGWDGDAGRWMYVPANQHDTDLQFVILWAQRRADRENQELREGIKA